MSSFFGGTTYDTKNLLTAGQQGLLSQMINQYSNIGNMAANMQSTYQGAAGDYFEQAIGAPMRSEYQEALSGLRHTGKRHSSFNTNQQRKLSQDFLTQIGSQRAQFSEEERLREMQALENLRASQLGLYGLQGQLGASATGIRAFENIAEQDAGMLGQLSTMLNLGGSLGSMFAGGFSGVGY